MADDKTLKRSKMLDCVIKGRIDLTSKTKPLIHKGFIIQSACKYSRGQVSHGTVGPNMAVMMLPLINDYPGLTQ